MIDWVSLGLFVGGMAVGAGLTRYERPKTVVDLLSGTLGPRGRDARVESAVGDALDNYRDRAVMYGRQMGKTAATNIAVAKALGMPRPTWFDGSVEFDDEVDVFWDPGPRT